MDYHQAHIYKKIKNAGVFFKYWPGDGPLMPKLAANNCITIQYYIDASDGVHV